MELGKVVEFFENKTILVTGATGFLAKIFVEKILRIQPNVKKIYLLIRATSAKSASQRFHDEVLGKELFKVLTDNLGENLESFMHQKVIPIAGDISLDEFGIKSCNLKKEMWRDIDVIVNSAATTKFDERYDVALSVNTFGTLKILNFAKKCINLKLILHVSTAYVCGEKEGIIMEEPCVYEQSPNEYCQLNIYREKKLMEDKLNELEMKGIATEREIREAMKDFGIQRARLFGWPNTYVFTKAMGEMLLQKCKDDLPLVIVRPTIVLSTYKEPFPGWTEGIRTVDSFIFGYGKGKVTTSIGSPETILDMIPGDIVVNLMIILIVRHAYKACLFIYHAGSSLANPAKLSDVGKYINQHFTKCTPWTDKNGNPIKYHDYLSWSSMAIFRTNVTIRYLLPLKVYSLANIIFGTEESKQHCAHLLRTLDYTMKMAELYRPYVFFKGVFDDTNSKKLQIEGRDGLFEEDNLSFDPKSIDWEEYFLKIHIPGFEKHVVRLNH